LKSDAASCAPTKDRGWMDVIMNVKQRNSSICLCEVWGCCDVKSSEKYKKTKADLSSHLKLKVNNA